MTDRTQVSRGEAPVTRSALVIEQIRQAILDGEYKWGGRLNELQLGSRFAVFAHTDPGRASNSEWRRTASLLGKQRLHRKAFSPI